MTNKIKFLINKKLKNFKFNFLSLFIIFLPLFFFNEVFISEFLSVDGSLNFRTKLILRILDFFYLITILILLIYFNLKDKIKIYLLTQLFYLKKNINISSVIFFIIFCIFFFQCFFYVRTFWIISPELYIVLGFDQDSASEIGFIKNGYSYFLPYGPLHSILIMFLKNFFLWSYDADIYTLERVIYFSSILLNYFCIIAISFIISLAITRDKKNILIISLVLFNIILANDFWFDYLFRARVDLVFSAFCGFFAFFYYRSFCQKKEFSLTSPFFAALSLLSKTSFIIFLPFIFVHQILAKTSIKNIILFYSLIVIFYIAGSINNIIYYDDLLKILIWLQSFSSTHTAQSIVLKIFEFSKQSYMIFAFIFLVIYFSNKKYNFFKKKLKFKNLYIFIIPVGYFIYISKQLYLPSSHYTLPLVVITSIFLGLKLSHDLEIKIFFTKKTIFLLIFSIFTLAFYNFINLENKGNELLERNKKIKEFYILVEKLNYNAKLVDAYVPLDLNKKKNFMCPHLQCSDDLLDIHQIDLLIFNSKDAMRIFDTNDKNLSLDTRRDFSNNIINFYKRFVSEDKIVYDNNNNLWQQVRLNPNYIIWQKIK